MPIYAYACASCGHAKDVLQKISDAPLTECPACGAAAFTKQLTAAGFQLKGSGWYATDFKGGNSAKKADGDSKTARGHVTEEMRQRYDHELPVVQPPHKPHVLERGTT